MTTVENLADDLFGTVAAFVVVLTILALLLAVVGPILVVSLSVEVVRWAHGLLA